MKQAARQSAQMQCVRFAASRAFRLSVLGLLIVASGCGPSREHWAAIAAAKQNRLKQEEDNRLAAEAAEAQRIAQERANREEAERAHLAAQRKTADRCLTASRMFQVLELAKLHYAYFSEFPANQNQLASPSDGSAGLISQVILDVWGGPIEIRWADGRLSAHSKGPDQAPDTGDDLVHRLRLQREVCGEPDFAIEVDARPGGSCVDASSAGARESEAPNLLSEALAELGYSDFHEFFKAQDGVVCGRLLPTSGQVQLGLRTEGRRRGIAELERRLAEVQLREWSMACNTFTAVQPSFCGNMDSPYRQGICLEVQRHAFKQRTVFSTPVLRTVTYDASKKAYFVKVFGLLRYEGGIELDDCITEQCSGQLVSLRPLKVAGGEANFYTWLNRYRIAINRLLSDAYTFRVPAAELGNPSTFGDVLQVDALVEVVGHQSSIVGDWFDYENVETRLLGLRAYTSDFGWTRMVQKPRIKPSRLECPWPGFFRDEPKK
jgi:hypothetical protein